MLDSGVPSDVLCDDEGCPQHGTDHVCIERDDAAHGLVADSNRFTSLASITYWQKRDNGLWSVPQGSPDWTEAWITTNQNTGVGQSMIIVRREHSAALIMFRLAFEHMERTMEAKADEVR